METENNNNEVRRPSYTVYKYEIIINIYNRQ